MSDSEVSRRTVLTGSVVALAGAIAGFVVARNSTLARPRGTVSTPGGGGYGLPSGYGSPSNSAPAGGQSGPSGGGTAGGGGSGTGAAPGGATPLAQVSSVPKGGGIVLADKQIVLTRDNQGNVHAFSSTCTHMGCTVKWVRQGNIICPCHGSEFNAATGAVVQGPATTPLPAVPVVVRGNGVYTS